MANYSQTMANEQDAPGRNVALEIVRVTEAAAIAASAWMGRGDKLAADGAAVDAMRKMLSTVRMNGLVIIGEGEKDEAPMLFNGERVGDGSPPKCRYRRRSDRWDHPHRAWPRRSTCSDRGR